MTSPMPTTSATTTRHPAVTATLWGGGGLLTGALTGVLLLLPLYPEDDSGFEGLGWFLMVLAVGGVLALAAGAAGIFHGLRRSGAEAAGRTALVFLPVAVLLGAVSGGLAAFAAPAAARWFVGGFARRVGWGRPAVGGLPQRLVVTLLLSGLLASWGLVHAGHELGGRVNGVWLAWGAVLPAVIVPPVLLLRRVLTWPVLAGGVVAAAVLLGLAAPGAAQNAHPTPERLEQIAQDLPVPEGQSVTDVLPTVLRDGSWDVPVTLLSTGGPVPSLSTAPDATSRGAAAAGDWEAALREQGWERTSSEGAYLYWLPDHVQRTLSGRSQYELGPWTRASVLPYGDGALVVLSVRP